jgi:hypothetical protein
MDLGKLLHVEPGKGYSSKISAPKRESDISTSSKDLTLTDDITQKLINVELAHIAKKVQDGKIIETEFEKPVRLNLSYQ